jgi:hypothetical protein
MITIIIIIIIIVIITYAQRRNITLKFYCCQPALWAIGVYNNLFRSHHNMYLFSF